MRVLDRTWRDAGVLLNSLPLLTLLTLFFVGPILLTVLLTFQEMQFYRLTWTWSLKAWSDVFSKYSYWIVIGRTVSMAFLSTFLCILIAYPAAYALATRLKNYSNHIQILIIFSFLTDAVLKTFGWVLVLDRSGIGNWILQHLGLGDGVLDFLFSPRATLLGVVYNLSVYPLFTIYLSLKRIDRDLVLAAYDAGASKWQTFREVTFPLSLPGVYAGAVLVFVLTLGTFLESKVLGGGKSPLASELIRQTFETRVNWPLGAALTVVLVVIAAIMLAGAIWLVQRTRRRETVK